jgi:hypothetical protein
LLRLHKWNLKADDAGGSYMQCSNCSKSKRVTGTGRLPDQAGGYGDVPAGGGGGDGT